MRRIPDELKEAIASSPLHGRCIRRLVFRDHECEGRITWEHAILYAGRQVNEVWAILELCEKAHSTGAYQDTGILDKRKNEYLAISRMTAADEASYPRCDWRQRRSYLKSLYGPIRIPHG